MKRATKKTPRAADKYELLRKALRADGLEVDTLDEDSSYLAAVLKFADLLFDIRSFCQE
jgi:hypothetical protein